MSTSHVVFIDADVQCTHEDICELAKWWNLPQLAVLAPRVKSLNWFQNGAVVAAYEEVRASGNAPAGGDTKAWPEFDAEKIKLRTRVIVITSEATLLTHQVRRELALIIPSESADDSSVLTSHVERYSYE